MLEPVKIEEQQRNAVATPLRAGDGALESIQQDGAVRQPGERIELPGARSFIERAVGRLGLGLGAERADDQALVGFEQLRGLAAIEASLGLNNVLEQLHEHRAHRMLFVQQGAGAASRLRRGIARRWRGVVHEGGACSDVARPLGAGAPAWVTGDFLVGRPPSSPSWETSISPMRMPSLPIVNSRN